MIIYYERTDFEGKKTAGALDVIDLDEFADQMIEWLDESPDRKVIILKIDKAGSVM